MKRKMNRRESSKVAVGASEQATEVRDFARLVA